jgi:hypothetical protein
LTPTDVQTLVDHAPMPPGYELRVEPQRRHKYRSLWNVRVFKDGERVWGRAYYNVAAGIRAGQSDAWLRAIGLGDEA